MKNTDRRTVLMTGGLALVHRLLPGGRTAAGTASPAVVQGADQSAPGGAGATETDVGPLFPSADPELVRAVVGASHAELERVTELVTDRPALARASIDWGFGDWESALGAASHMGRRDIADVLIAHGARPDIFSAAMMGQVDTVRAFVEAQPGIQRIPGPHGISLLAHAGAGGEASAAAYEYLDRLGDADPSGPGTIELTVEQRAAFVGTYAFGGGVDDYFALEESRGSLSLRRGGYPFGRRLFAVSATEFYPSGSWDVRIAFHLEGARATRLRVVDGAVILTASR